MLGENFVPFYAIFDVTIIHEYTRLWNFLSSFINFEGITPSLDYIFIRCKMSALL